MYSLPIFGITIQSCIMKNKLVLVLTLAFVNITSAQLPNLSKEFYITDTKGNKISPKLCLLESFNENGLAICAIDGYYIENKGYYSYDSHELVNAKYGVINKDGKYVLPPSYKSISYDSQNKLFIFQKDQNVGLIDINGKEIFSKKGISITQNYYFPSHYTVKLDQFSNDIINSQGTVVASNFNESYDFDKGYFIYKNNLWSIIDHNGNKISDPNYADLTFISSIKLIQAKDKFGKYLVLKLDKDNNIKELTKDRYDNMTFIYSNDYTKCLGIQVTKGSKLGVISSSTFDVQVPIIYDELNGAEIKNSSYFIFKSKEKYGLIDLNGNVLLKPIYNSIDIALKSHIVVAKGGKKDEFGWGYVNEKYSVVDLKGKELIKTKFDGFEKYSYGNNIMIFKIGNNYCAYDTELNPVLKPEYAFIKDNDNCIVLNKGGVGSGYDGVQGGVYGVLNKDFSELLPFKYESMELIGYGEDAKFIIKKDGKYGLIDINGKSLIEPKYASLNCRNDKFYIVSIFEEKSESYKYGVIKNQLPTFPSVIPEQYDFVEIIEGKKIVFRVKQKNSWGVLDENNKQVVPFNYNFVKGSDSYYSDNKYFVVNINGNTIQNEYSLSYDVEGGSYGILSETGEFILPTNLSKAEIKSDSSIFTKGEGVNGLMGLFDLVNKRYKIPANYEYIEGPIAYDIEVYKVGKDVKFSEYGYLERGTYGVVNHKNEIIVPINFSELEYVQNKFIGNTAEVFGGFYLYNLKGEELLASCDKIQNINDTLVLYKNKNQVNIFNIRTKQNILKGDFVDFNVESYFYRNTFIALKNTNNLWGYYTATGEEIIAPQYVDAKGASDPYFIVAKKGDNNTYVYGVIDASNHVVIPFEYDQIEDSYNHIYLCSKNNINQAFSINLSNEVIKKQPISESLR